MRRLELVPAISKIGLGAWQFGSWEWGYGETYARREARAIVRRALGLGVTLYDTAELYGFGRSERILGAALGEDAERVFVATKLFPVLPLAPIVRSRARRSAARLGVAHLDLYQIHQPNPVVGDGSAMRGMGELQDAGLVREVGVSNYPLERWRRAEAALGRRVLSDQVRYNLVARGPERDLIPYAEREGRVVIAYSPLAQGFLSGRYGPGDAPRDRLRRHSRLFRPDSLRRAEPLLRTLREVGEAHGATPAQVALAWTIRSPAVVAIAGARTVAQAEENAAAADVELGEDEVEALSGAASAFAV